MSCGQYSTVLYVLKEYYRTTVVTGVTPLSTNMSYDNKVITANKDLVII